MSVLHVAVPVSRPRRLRKARTWILVGGEVLSGVHLKSKCVGRKCCIHNPSDHHMRTWRMHWRGDRQIMERICPEHGCGHPDPDDICEDTIHGCCGCCHAG